MDHKHIEPPDGGLGEKFMLGLLATVMGAIASAPVVGIGLGSLAVLDTLLGLAGVISR